MHIKIITVRSYRIHRECTVELDRRLNVIGGPNETGKSTLIEAVHKALFLKAKVTGSALDDMRSTLHAGNPEVELTFHLGDREFRLHKEFKGPNGTTLLSAVGGDSWHGDEAESRLADLLKVESIGGGRGVAGRAASQWAHLWVWQGQAGTNPESQANEQRDNLLTRLQEAGPGAVMQSETDHKVARRFADLVGELFTSAGKPKKHSPLDKALEAQQAASDRLTLAKEKVDGLESARQEYLDAVAALEQAEKDRKTLKASREALKEREKKVRDLQAREKDQARVAGESAAAVEALEKADAEIRELEQDIRQLEDKLGPLEKALKDLAASVAEREKGLASRQKVAEELRQATTRARRTQDLARAWATLFEQRARQGQLQEKAQSAAGLRKQIEDLEKRLHALPRVTASKLEELRGLDRTCAQKESGLKSMATGLEVETAGDPVRLDNRELQVGEPIVVTEPAVVEIGKKTRLRLSPGGGQSLAEAREELREAREELQEALAALSLASLEEAVQALDQAQSLKKELDALTHKLEALGGDDLDRDLKEAGDAVQAAEAEVKRRKAAVPDVAAPDDLESARQLAGTAEAETTDLEEKQEEAEAALKAGQAELAASRQEKDQAEQDLTEDRQRQVELKARLTDRLEKSGQAEAREKALRQAREVQGKAQETLEAIRTELSGLNPDQLEADAKRLDRAEEAQREARESALESKSRAEERLTQDGSSDPQAELAKAEAAAELARTHLESVQLQAEARKLLNDLFQEEQRHLAEQFTRPLADKTAGYLQSVFGAGTEVRLNMADQTFSNLGLVRADRGGQNFSFDVLSGGTREQVAVAFRLAMAEILAADHDGALPVVLDDAFTNSDPDRVRALQQMLDRAAGRGLQIIVLTCNPADYVELGARSIQMNRPTFQMARPAPAAPVGQTATASQPGEPSEAKPEQSSEAGAGPPEEPDPALEPLRTAFLNKLRELGGSQGNKTLREALGWEPGTYDTVKGELVGAGAIQTGRGRGGSVALAGE